MADIMARAKTVGHRTITDVYATVGEYPEFPEEQAHALFDSVFENAADTDPFQTVMAELRAKTDPLANPGDLQKYLDAINAAGKAPHRDGNEVKFQKVVEIFMQRMKGALPTTARKRASIVSGLRDMIAGS